MKRFVSLLMVALVMLGLGCAQKSARPWYGSKLSETELISSGFCKKYTCEKKEDQKYINSQTKKPNHRLELVSRYNRTIYDKSKKSDVQIKSDISLVLIFNESNNLTYLRMTPPGGFGPPPNTVLDEISAQYLTDLVAVALGKKYRYVPRDGDANPTDDMNTKCMTGIDLSKKVYRILEQGKIAFEGETKARPYVAYCMVRPSRDNPNEWPKINQPMFAIYDSVYIPK